MSSPGPVQQRRERGDQHRELREERLDHVIDVAAQLFAERGFGSVGMSEICDRVDLGRGQLYSLIGSKENLLKLIHDRMEGLVTQSAARLAALDAPPASRLRTLFRDLVAINMGHRNEVRVYFHEWRGLGEENRTAYRARRREYQQIVEDLLRSGVDDGSFLVLDIKLTARAILNMVSPTNDWMRHGRPSPQKIADVCCDLVLGGITA